MADRVTWETCPECGGLAAIGWARARGSASLVEAVEFDCPNGCQAPNPLSAYFTPWSPDD